jgi:translocation and assembly module TamB
MVSLHPEQPSLRINASGARFGYGDIQATGIEIVDQSDNSGVINAEIKAEQISVRGDIFENVTVGLVADSVAQSLRLDASYGDADVHLLVAGEVDDLKHASGWQGELRELRLALAGKPIAELSAPTAISLSENGVTIDRSCIAASTGMRLCAQADWSDDSYLDMRADMTDVPVELVNSFIDTSLHFDQLVSGDFNWSQSEESGTTGNARISMSAGTVTSDDYPDASIVTETGLLSFDIANGQLLSGDAALSMPGFGHISAQFSIPDIADGANSGINGVFDIDLSDMAVLAALMPLVDAATGEFHADLALSGTLSEPQLVGEMAVINGSLTSLAIGLQLDEIELTSRLHEDGQAELSGNFLAGEGRGEIVTRADYSTTGETGFELELRGNNMTLIDTPNVTARADLDVRIAYDYKNLTLDGQILVSHARVNPSNLTVTSHSESEDVVIVAGELPDDTLRQSGEQEPWILGSIGVEFGDDVFVDLGPATAKVTGKTVFSWEEDLIPIADGRYDVTGSVQAFGQVLEITEGGLRFPQIPANNPFIRIRAEREIYGNAQVKTAGILMDGTLKQLTIEPYTRPLTTEERALTLLVTGSDFDFEQGLGAIDFGTYISPRVFVSYGVGLFETENVIRVRYDLKRGFGITTTSGEKESGVDLSYRIER